MLDFPAKLMSFADCLGSETGVGGMKQRIGTGGFEYQNLRIDRRLCDIVGGLSNDHRGGFRSECRLEAGKISFSQVVVLINHSYLRGWLSSQQIFRVNVSLDGLWHHERGCPWQVFRVVEFRRTSKK